ncbi:HAD-IB family hydrolase [Candidatus Saccharibacteria bacterium]|nr:HAD-IB family hydrolase [Candidatus Saccharibacteria bacterium]
MKQKLAAFDIDGTLFRSGLYREVFYELTKMGAIPDEHVEETTRLHRKWRDRLHGNAFEEFEKYMVQMLDVHITSLKIADYEQAAQRVLEKKAENVYVYTRNLMRSLKEQGYFLVAISGSQLDLVEPFAVKYGFDAWVGQEWEKGQEYFTGNITKTHTGKDVILQGIIDKHSLTLQNSYAVGDSNGDVGMLSMVEHPIAFNPTHELYEKAISRGWDIVVERKNVSYTLKKDLHSDAFILAEAKFC